jgi:stress-induced morphogen
MLEPERVRALLVAAFADAEVELVDLTGTQDHYQARIVSRAFEGRSMLEQHQLVYGALGSAMHGPIHAFALTTYTPASWARLKGD